MYRFIFKYSVFSSVTILWISFRKNKKTVTKPDPKKIKTQPETDPNLKQLESLLPKTAPLVV